MRKSAVAIICSLALCVTALAGRTLKTSQSGHVSASASEVWDLLIKPDQWPEWNPAVAVSRLLEGDGESVGGRIKFLPVIGNRKSPKTVTLVIVKSEKPKTLEYRAKLPGTNILFGFSIADDNSGCTVTSYETIEGLLSRSMSQEDLDEEHRIWIEAIKNKLEREL